MYLEKSLLLYFLLAMIFLFGLIIGLEVSGVSVFYCAVAILGLLVTALFRRRPCQYLYFFIYSISTLFIVIFYELSIYDFGAPYYLGGSDDLAYENDALILFASPKWWLYSPAKIGEVLNAPWHNSKGYVYFLTILHFFGEKVFDGYNTIVPRQLNAIFLALTCVVFFKIFEPFTKDKKKLLLAFSLFGTMPIVQYISSHVFRDVGTLLVVALIIYFIKYSEKSKIKSVFFVLLFSAILSQLRVFYVPFLILIILFFGASKCSFYKNKILMSTLTFLSFLVISSLIYYDYGVLGEIVNSVLSYNKYVAQMSDGYSKVIFSSPLIVQPFLRIAYSVVYPVPVLSPGGQASAFIYSLGTLFQIFVFFLGVRGIFLLSRESRAHYVILAAVIFYLAFSLGTFTFRHQLFFMPFIFGFFGVALSIKSMNNVLITFFAAFVSISIFGLLGFIRYL